MNTQPDNKTASGNAPKVYKGLDDWRHNRVWNKANVEQFNFTWAIDGGAWLRTRDLDGLGTRDTNWFSASQVDQILGKGEFQRLFKKQGMFTGCWINV